MCNIPVINIFGSKEDWLKIMDTANNILPKFELDEWLKDLNIIIGNIIATYDGNIDEKFFDIIYKFYPISYGELNKQ